MTSTPGQPPSSSGGGRPRKPFAVLGLGRSGVAAARFFSDNGQRAVALDDHPNPPRLGELADLPGVEVHVGGFDPEILKGAAAVLLSPGVPRAKPEIQAAIRAGVPVINDVEWLYRWDRFHKKQTPFVGVTGTNGKSTVTTLIGLMLEASGLRAPTGGNLGAPALSLWDPDAEVYVLELSSYQLESIASFRPKASVLLNLSPDHMDRYPDFTAYKAAKARLFSNQSSGDAIILNRDDPALKSLHGALSWKPSVMVPVSINAPQVGGVYVDDGALIDHREGKPLPLLPVDRIKIVGPHNRANAAAAAAAALSVGATHEAVAEVLTSFPGLPHRMEWIRTIDGADWYNDSKGTNVDAAIQALNSFDRGTVLIAGGRDKASDFSPLAALATERADAVILIGEAADAMATAFADHPNVIRAASLEEAAQRGKENVRPGGAVLLSPACASFDMFKNFEARGDRFRELVHGL